MLKARKKGEKYIENQKNDKTHSENYVGKKMQDRYYKLGPKITTNT
jgi:hypothetical protein